MASSFRDLIAWQKAMDLVEQVYLATATWPSEHRYGLTSQTQRSAVSVPSNIAEGHERRSSKDYLRFLAITNGSLAELETQLGIASRIGIESIETSSRIIDSAREVGRIVRGIERKLGRSLTDQS